MQTTSRHQTRSGAAPAPPPPHPPVAARGVSKWFPGLQALNRVSLEVFAGEVHGLVGGNGAGKSTLIKILTGAETPDEGSIALAPTTHGGNVSITAIYQELTIAANLSALSNVFLGSQPRFGPFLRYGAMRSIYAQIAAELGTSIDPKTLAADLSVADQQLVEIMRAMTAKHKVLIMDEPTASLGVTQRNKLYQIVRGLRSQGVGILYVSHDLDEVIDLCDRISIMRDGRLIATEQASAWNKQSIVEVMLTALPPKLGAKSQTTSSAVVLQADGLRPRGGDDEISFSLRKGEVLGIAGLVGAGRTEILRALAGADAGGGGSLLRNGAPVQVPQSVRQALALGIALVPEDRKTQGLVGPLPAMDNMTLTDLPSVSTVGFTSRRRRFAVAQRIGERLRLASHRLETPSQALSGGNQQKVVIGKWLHRRPEILLLDEPTRGVDLGAKAELYATIRSLAQTGISFIVVSSEFEELVDNCDRILLLSSGRFVGELDGKTATADRILEMLFQVEGPTTRERQ
jgi:ABC-type sugar transport system ATPase subunit